MATCVSILHLCCNAPSLQSGAGGSQVGSVAELDEEVENMMYLAKGDFTGGTPRLKPTSFQQVAEVHPDSGSQSSLSSTTSAEKGILVKPHVSPGYW